MDNLLKRKLRAWERPIRVAVSGAGRFSRGLIGQSRCIDGLEIVAVSDTDTRYAREALLQAGYDESDLCCTDRADLARSARERGKVIVCEHPLTMLGLEIDAVVEASGSPETGAAVALEAIRSGRHVIMVTIEADVAVGPVLREYAERHGVVYTLADGDQPSIAKGLYNWADTLGLDVTVIGKWSGVYTEEEAERRMRQNGLAMRESDVAYLDGSKNQIEMACIANMTGFAPDIPGMHMPRAAYADIPNVFRTKEERGILRRRRIVDVVNCRDESGRLSDPHFRGGVFLVFTSPDRRVLEQLGGKGITMSDDGQYGLIYRQHHMIGVETPMSILKAVLLGEGTGSPLTALHADVVCVAKRDLRAGQRLDGQGGETVRGIAVGGAESLEARWLPLSLAQQVSVKQDVAKGTRITTDMLEQPGDSAIWRLRRQLAGQGGRLP